MVAGESGYRVHGRSATPAAGEPGIGFAWSGTPPRALAGGELSAAAWTALCEELASARTPVGSGALDGRVASVDRVASVSQVASVSRVAEEE